MSFEDSSHDSDPSMSPRPSIPEQEERLKSLLSANMQGILKDRDFFSKLISQYKVIFPESDSPTDGNDMSVVVARNCYGRKLEDGTWQEGEAMQVGFVRSFGGKSSVTSYIHVANRVDTLGGPELVAVEPFNQEEGANIAGMIDELLFAKASGRIPDLHEMCLDFVLETQN